MRPDGVDPAEKAWMRPMLSRFRIDSSRIERAEFPVHRISIFMASSVRVFCNRGKTSEKGVPAGTP